MKLALISNPATEQGLAAIKDIVNALAARQPTVGYIASQPDPQRTFYQQTRDLYHQTKARLNLYVGLEDEFDQAVVEQLFTCSIIHLSGGETFRFLKWLKIRQLEQRLTDYLHAGGALIGVSAGAMLLTPSIASAALCGDENNVALDDLSALSLVPFHFVPHLPGPGISRDEIINRSAALPDEVLLCGDNDSLTIINGEMRLHGTPEFAYQGRLLSDL